MQDLKEGTVTRYTNKKLTCPLLPVLQTLKVLGRVPFTMDETDKLQFHVFSLPMLWAAVITPLQIYLVVLIYMWRLVWMRPSWDFDKTISTINDLLFLNSSFHGVIATWRSTPRIVRAINRWTALHEQVQSKTGKRMTSVILDHSYIGVLIVSLSVSLMFITSYLTESPLYLFEILIDAVYFVCIFYFNIILLFWIFLCVMVKRTAKLLNDHLQQVLSNSHSADDVLCLRHLWLELHACTTDLVDGIGSTLQMCISLGFCICLFSIYGLLTIAFSGRFTDLIFLLNALVTTSVSAFVNCAISDSAQTSVSSDIILTIHSTRWTRLSESVRSQLTLLLDAVEMGKPCFEVRGLFILDKVFFISVVYAVITDLVVLMQFKVSTLPA